MKRFNLITMSMVLALALVTHQSAIAQSKIKPIEEKSLSILFVGDIVLDGGPGKSIDSGIDPFAKFASIFQQADVRVGNLECVVATAGHAAEKNFTFRAAPHTLPFLKKHIDIVSLANNHSGDFGSAAFSEMLGLLDQHQIGRFGGGYNLQEAHQPYIIEKNGLRIALLGYNEFMPRSFEANTQSAGIAWSEDEQVVLDIKNARRNYKADIVIPMMHWGWENEMLAGARQRSLARIMIDAGADAVIGGHPHVIQDTEQYKGKPIIYSIGNFMIDAMDNEAQTLGWAVKLSIDQNGVKAWDTQTAKINDEGIPSPESKATRTCWQRGDLKAHQCQGK
jgi:poly-gamma-glutamate capsule biosynthesis protein CapA/YwtB (metallophosphatase superfamily)